VRVAFVITGNPEYRVLGPVIDQALASGWSVECWHDYGRVRDGLKAYVFPAVEGVPRFHHGRPPVVRTYATGAELVSWLEREDVDAVVAIGTLQMSTAGARLPAKCPPWICVQVSIDTFVINSIEMLNSCNRLALQTPWWADWATSYYEGKGATAGDQAIRARLEGHAEYVGYPEADARRLIDPQEVRRRWGIPHGQPVVALLPFPQGVGRASFWPKKIFGDARRARRLLHMLAQRQFRYWRRALSDASDEDVVRALRAFCDREGAFLLVKSRRKTPIPRYTRAAADLCLVDESYYPATILEVMSIASLCVSFYSSAVHEAAAMSVPNLCITFTPEDYLGEDRADYILFDRFYTRAEGSMFQFAGVSETATPAEAIATLKTRPLSGFTVDPVARQAYLRKFLGDDDGRGAARVLEVVERSVAQASVPVS
jgi:hypothetical protein